MILITHNLRELAGSIVALRMNCNSKSYPTEFQTYDEAWEELRRSFEHLRSKLGDARCDQLVDMAAQAKAHYAAEGADEQQAFLASWLMQDMEQVVKGKVPFAYPEDKYRWSR